MFSSRYGLSIFIAYSNFSRRPLTAEVSSCEAGGQSGSKTGFSASIPTFPCHYHSTNASSSSSLSQCQAYQNYKRAKHGTQLLTYLFRHTGEFEIILLSGR